MEHSLHCGPKIFIITVFLFLQCLSQELTIF